VFFFLSGLIELKAPAACKIARKTLCQNEKKTTALMQRNFPKGLIGCNSSFVAL
jgi:hypothetical protein